MKLIYTRKGEAIKVDDEDYPALSKRPWHIHTEGYAKTYRRENGKVITIYMHRLLVPTEKGLVVDHINGDKTDNRRANLRVCRIAENIRGAKLSKKNTTGCKGVTKVAGKNKWVATIRLDLKRICLGTFDNVEAAAAAYKEASLKYHGIYSPYYPIENLPNNN